MVSKSLLIVALLTSSLANASSPGAWAEFNAKVAQSCNAASGLQQPRSGKVVGFDDTLGKVVTLVIGTSGQKQTPAVTVTMLCIYDQRSGQTWITEAEGWKSPDR